MTSYSAGIIVASMLSLMIAVSANGNPSSSSPDLFGSFESKTEGVGGDKRLLVNDIDNMEKRTFIMGSRYGRSSPSGVYGRAGRLSVSPRNDRFFLGSRYGKRTNEYPLPAVQTDTNESGVFSMACVFTGFKDYFRCSKLTNIAEHLSNEDSSNV